nr:hypothetical protein [Tanacetum cinerariifolium]
MTEELYPGDLEFTLGKLGVQFFLLEQIQDLPKVSFMYKRCSKSRSKENESSLRYIILPNWAHDALLESTSSKPYEESRSQVTEGSRNPNSTASIFNPPAEQMETLIVESPIPTVSSPVPTACLHDSSEPSSEARLVSKRVANKKKHHPWTTFYHSQIDEIIGVEADVSYMETSIFASPTPTLRIHKDHPKSQIIGPVDTPIQTRHKSKMVEEQSFMATIHQKTNPALLQFCLYLCFLSQVEPKKVSDALQDPSWVEAMKEELLQFKIQKVWTLVDLAQGHTQEEGIDYDEVFAPVARIEAIRLFLAYASFMGFRVYQMDVKNDFLYGTIHEEVYVMQSPGFHDPVYPAKVYKVEKAMYGLHQAPRAWYGKEKTSYFGSSNPQLCREFEALMHEKFQMSAMGELNFFLGLQVLQKEDGIFLSQDKYIGDILKKFKFSDVRYSNTPMDKENPWGKDGPGHPKLGLWYPKASPFDLVAYSDSDYGGASQHRKSTTVEVKHVMRGFVKGNPHLYTLFGEFNTDFHPMVDFIAASPL